MNIKTGIILFALFLVIFIGGGLFLFGDGLFDSNSGNQTTSMININTSTQISTYSLNTTNTSTPIITSKTILENTGVVKGHLSYFDGTPASRMSIWVFEYGEDTSYKEIITDNNGDYLITNIPVGSYELYTATFRHDTPISYIKFLTYEELLPPDAIINVENQQTTIVPIIIIPKEITKIYYMDTESSISVDITLVSVDDVIINQPAVFSWEAIPTATSYSVLFRPLNGQSPNWDDSIIIKETVINSPTLLPYRYYLMIQAFDDSGNRVGEGMGFFAVQ
jgi:hypothetical protein